MSNDPQTPELIIHGVGTFTPPPDEVTPQPADDTPRRDNEQENS